MDDLRWILLMIGGVIVAAIFFSGRFEREDWLREREERKIREKAAKSKTGKIKKKPRAQPEMHGEPGRVVTGSHGSANINQDEITGQKSRGPKASEASAKEMKPQATVAEKRVAEKKEPTFVEAQITKKPEKNQSVASGFVPSPNVPADKAATIEALSKAQENGSDAFAMPSIEDEIVEVEIPIGLVDAEAELKSKQENPVDIDSVQGELPLGVEPLVLVVTVVAEEGQQFSGPEIQEALEAEGLEYGDMKIFHYHVDNHKDAVFSVANIMEPGFFEIEKIDTLETMGLSVFCQLPGPLPGNEALDIMLDKGRGIAVRLQGRMCDDKRNMVTAQVTAHYKDRIATFDHELALARKKGQ